MNGPRPYQPQIGQIQSQLQNFQGPINQQDLRFNPQIAEQFRGIDRNLLATGAQGQSGINRLGEDLASQTRQAENMRDAAGRALEARMADQGILRSGVNVGARSDLNQNFIEQLNNMGTDYSRGVSDINSGLASAAGRANAQRESLRMSQARQEAATRQQEEFDRAGSLSGLEYALGLLQQLEGPNNYGGGVMPTGPKPDPTQVGMRAPKPYTNPSRNPFAK